MYINNKCSHSQRHSITARQP